MEAYYIARALVAYIMILSPEKIILGGGVMYQPQLFPLIRKEVARQVNQYIRTRQMEQLEDYIVAANLGDDQGIFIEKVVKEYPDLTVCEKELEQAVEWIVEMHQAKGTLLLCDNGGSAADCEHISGELLEGFLSLRSLPEEERAGIRPDLAETLQGGIRAISLVSLTAVSTAFSNDVAVESAFAQLVNVFGEKENVFLGISTSGNAANVCAAAEVARARGQKTISLTGKDGGKLAQMCDCSIRVPVKETYMVQELHLPVYHALCAEVEARIFGKD